MSNLYTRLQGAITTALGGITLCNYLRKYLGKTHVRLCHAMKEEKQREGKRKRGSDNRDLFLRWLGCSLERLRGNHKGSSNAPGKFTHMEN